MYKILLSVFISLVALVGFSGCLKNDRDYYNQQCNYDSCAVKAPSTEIQTVQKYLTDSNLTATQHCSGAFYRIEAQGTGVSPTACSYVTIRYKGKLANGQVFDQTQPGNSYSSYLGNLIRGWVNTLPYLKSGGKIIMYIPPSLGYGDKDIKDSGGNVVIPANSMLIFEVELLSVQ